MPDCHAERRWRILAVEILFAGLIFIGVVFIARPVFLIPLQDEAEPPLTAADILDSLDKATIVGYAPNNMPPYDAVMARVSELLGVKILSAESIRELNRILYDQSQGKHIVNKVFWIVFNRTENVHKVSLKSSEIGKYGFGTERERRNSNAHLRAGFLAVQVAISQALLEISSPTPPLFDLRLVSMPVSPLMEESKVLRVVSIMLMCFTIALMPPVMEAEFLVIVETRSQFKNMIQPHAWTSCVWSSLFTLLQTFLAELMVNHNYSSMQSAFIYILHMAIPPLGLLNGLDEFALIHTGTPTETQSMVYTIISWLILIFLYSTLLILLQYTIGQERAIGGQVSWKSIMFKKAEDIEKLRPIEIPTDTGREHLQEVDEFVAKAITFNNVSKSIMQNTLLQKVSFEIYRGEYTILFTERAQEKMMSTIEDLLCGLTFPDNGTINVMGTDMTPSRNFMAEPYMLGYCDNGTSLIDDLTVEEHLMMFIDICLWNEHQQYVAEYTHLRLQKLLRECDLEAVLNYRVSQLDVYYRAQLSWALALLMEPRVIIVPTYGACAVHFDVIKDRIVSYKKYVTIVKISFTSVHLEQADRVFIFDKPNLAFGGTPAYMFFKYGREYRFRLSLRNVKDKYDDRAVQILQKAQEAGASVRAHLGSLLILRIPATPTERVAALIKDFNDNAQSYGISYMNISVADTEEVFRRILCDVKEKRSTDTRSTHSHLVSHVALKKISEPRTWTKKLTFFACILHIRVMGWKFFTFHVHYRFFLIITVIAAMVTGVFMGLSLATTLTQLEEDIRSSRLLYGDVLTVESLDTATTLALRVDDQNDNSARILAHAYVLSETNSSKSAVDKMEYVAVSGTESLTEYLVTCAIESPQIYVTKYAYGMDVSVDAVHALKIQALYSPLHPDRASAARSLARVYMALIRFYTGIVDASIEFINDPLIMDAIAWLKGASTPPFLIEFLLILTVAHITLIPSKEYGLIRHTQSHAANFSPARYWLTLFFWDLVLYCVLVILMTTVMFIIMSMTANPDYYSFKDVVAIPFMLCIYGMGCIPIAFFFSLGPRSALNAMALIIVSVVFGETTIIAKWFYGDIYNYAVNIMSLSPQYNMASAFVTLRKIFLYNSECNIFRVKKFCLNKALHKCCDKCGVLQKCFKRKPCLTNIQHEVLSTIFTAMLMMSLLLMWEYKMIQRIWKCSVYNVLYVNRYKHNEEDSIGVQREKTDVIAKEHQILQKKHTHEKVDTFGEYILAVNVSKTEGGMNKLQNVYLGLGKSEAVALSGLMRHGRLLLCQILAGYRMPDEGHVWAMSNYRLNYSPHKYAKNVSLCCDLDALPKWMTLYDSLTMLGLLRGVPVTHIHQEVDNYIKALGLGALSNMKICRLKPIEQKRLNFAVAVIGAPPVIVLDECTAYQKFGVRRAMYYIMYELRKRGHAIFISSSNVESHMPVTHRLAILLDGSIKDVDQVSCLLNRYSEQGFTVVVHLKDEVDIVQIFRRYFNAFVINDTSDVLVNVQILDNDLSWSTIFEKMEKLKNENSQVYSYIVTAITIDYIYNRMLSSGASAETTTTERIRPFFRKFFRPEAEIKVPLDKLERLKTFDKVYDITTLTKLPWSVIFHR
ncbi:ABC transporter A family member 3-like [Hyposmocoma kahamanoa]|uniref:ABC transporter A family member 3-like n=1 Tax=Hyposmocoma kahamanoa TaxID=1477025 RepID=UPI000E6DA180|nr:ABC transporter A family member 3-like [Hyposmocoma kahamanoa]